MRRRALGVAFLTVLTVTALLLAVGAARASAATKAAMVRDIAHIGSSSDPGELTNVNGTLFFTAGDGTDGHELWKSDGTAKGTRLVKDINRDGGSDPGALTSVDGTLFFS